MPNYRVSEEGSYRSVVVELEGDEQFTSEAGAMFRSSDNIVIDVTTRSRGNGGLMGGVRRMMAGESFFLSSYQTRDHAPGEVGLAPTLAGDLAVIECPGVGGWLCAGGSYLGSSDGLSIDTQFQGFRGMFSGESLFFLDVQGRGQLIVSAFGSVKEIDVEGALMVDTGHVVAFEDSLEYTISRAGGGWIRSFLSSEGSVMRFSGHGKIYTQSHNPDQFGQTLGGLMPPRS